MNCTTNSCGCTNPGSCTNPCELVVRGMLVARIIERFRVIEKEIRDDDIQRKAQGESINSPQEWTEKIRTSLGTLGQSLGFSARPEPGGCQNADCGEWLWDIIWAKFDETSQDEESNGNQECWNEEDEMQELVLAGESEWGIYGEVLKDFRKLLVSRATIRLMVYDIPTTPKKDRENKPPVYERLRGHIHAFKHNKPGDTYLLVASNEDKKGNWWLEYVVLVVNDQGTTDIVEKGKIMNGEIHPLP